MLKKFILPVAAALLFLPLFSAAQAQEALPEMPPPIKDLADKGAQIRFLGKDLGFDAWLTVKNGQEQYFYVLPGGKAFVMGLLFDDTGKLITVDQVKRLRDNGDTLLDELADDSNFNTPGNETEKRDLSTPSEKLFSDIEGSNWIPFGKINAPAVYAFIDPQCPHCHAFFDDLRKGGYLDGGKIQLRLIPVGFKDDTRAQAAYLLATPKPQEKWFAHLDGDTSALPAKSEISQQGVQRNLAIMQSWQFSVTPMIVYRDKTGAVKLIRGRPKDMETLVGDITAPKTDAP